MRFAFVLTLMVMAGAAMGTAAQLLVGPQNSSVPQTNGFQWANIKFDISDLNPIKLVFDEVQKQVTSGANRPSFAVGTPVPVADFSKMDAQFKLNNEKFQRMSGSASIDVPESGPR